jgi:hypothetical protein
MKKWKTVAVVLTVLFLALGFGGIVRRFFDEPALAKARKVAYSPIYDADIPGYAKYTDNNSDSVQNCIHSIEKAQEGLKGVWLVSSTERSKLESRMSTRKAKMEALLTKIKRQHEASR